MKIVRSKIISIDNQQITITLCRNTLFYDIVATSSNIVLLEKIKSYYDLRDNIILDSVLGKPMLVIDSCDGFSYGIPFDSFFSYFSALKVFKRFVKEIRGFL